MKNIYVICPYGLVTGGPDALHQLVYYMNKLGMNAHLVYCDIKKKNKKIPLVYQIYIDEYLTLDEIIDSPNSIIIVPETLATLLKKYKKLKRYIWWLSVDNNTKTSIKEKITKVIKKIFNLSTYKKLFTGYYSIKKIKNYNSNKIYNFNNENKEIIHLCASYYAYDYVKKHSRNCLLLIEPISLFYLNSGKFLSTENRKNLILYNPKKNYAFTKKIIKCCKNLTFVPLNHYNQNELLNIYRQSKLYIDFGYFPGAERIPKEAAFNGCIVLTGTYGASNFYEDVCLPGEYKIKAKDENLNLIKSKIENCLNNYESLTKDMSNYVNKINSLEEDFKKSILNIFK